MTEETTPSKKKLALRKGNLVKVNRQLFENSLEAKASDQSLPEYIFQGPGELLIVKGEYAQVRWRKPVPDAWFRIDQLEAWS